jgi:hypothetical protein
MKWSSVMVEVVIGSVKVMIGGCGNGVWLVVVDVVSVAVKVVTS